MKKLSLDETWRLCLKMWKWIAKQIRKYKNFHQLSIAGKTEIIFQLKRKWCRKNKYNTLNFDCFFCEYAKNSSYTSRNCEENCPARKIDKEFNCHNLKYDFIRRPITFYNKLVSLNKKRLAKKKKKVKKLKK